MILLLLYYILSITSILSSIISPLSLPCCQIQYLDKLGPIVLQRRRANPLQNQQKAPETSDANTIMMPTPAFEGTYAIAYFLATISLIILLLIIPPMCWHLRNKTLAATILIAWLIILLLFNAINALIWPSDDFTIWYNGTGLCDLEIKVQVAAQVALPACFARILRALAGVMDSRRVSVVPSKRQKRRGFVGDVIWCVVFPLLQMLGQWVVQPNRYLVYGITGCVAPGPANWMYVLLIVVPPAVWVAIGTYYAGKLISFLLEEARMLM